MKIKFDSFEVEIKAKGVYNSTKYNPDDTLAVLNYISILCTEAGDWNKEHGYSDESYRKNARELYEFCEEQGLYSIKED